MMLDEKKKISTTMQDLYVHKSSMLELADNAPAFDVSVVYHVGDKFMLHGVLYEVGVASTGGETDES